MSMVRGVIVAVLVMVEVSARPGDLGAQGRGAFLQLLEGQWSVTSEATLGPGQKPVRSESRVVARLLARKWLVAENTGSTPDGQPVTSILTLGHDPAAKRVVGTWISSMQAHMWSYTGVLNGSGTALTLETEGPILGDPTKKARYREIIEIADSDHHTVRSLILGPDGKWFEFARAEYRRM